MFNDSRSDSQAAHAAWVRRHLSESRDDVTGFAETEAEDAKWEREGIS